MLFEETQAFEAGYQARYQNVPFNEQASCEWQDGWHYADQEIGMLLEETCKASTR